MKNGELFFKCFYSSEILKIFKVKQIFLKTQYFRIAVFKIEQFQFCDIQKWPILYLKHKIYEAV